MPSRELKFEVFDADNHMYETPEALTKFLPAEYKGVIDYVAGKRPDQDRGPRPDQRLHPQPDLRAWSPRPGPRRSTSRSATPRASPAGRSWQADHGPARPSASPAPARAHERAGHRPGPDVPDPGQPDRGAHARRPDRRSTSCTPSTSGCTSTGRSTTRTGSSPPRSSTWASPTRRSRSSSGWWRAEPRPSSSARPPPSGTRAPARSPCPSSIPSGSWSRPALLVACTPRTAATSATSTSGRACEAR